MFSISTRVETPPQADRDSPPKVVKTFSSPSSSFSGSNRSHPTTSKRSLPGCSTIAYSIPLLIATACATNEFDFISNTLQDGSPDWLPKSKPSLSRSPDPTLGRFRPFPSVSLMPRTCHPCRHQSRRRLRWICGRLSRRSQLRPERFERKVSSRWVAFGVVAGLSEHQLGGSAARRDWSLCETSLTLLYHLLQQPQLPDLKVLIYSLSLVSTGVISHCLAKTRSTYPWSYTSPLASPNPPLPPTPGTPSSGSR